ncbi:C45 family autoproteolytic acyltransferase/hydolase [Roseinatronobacter monicus]|uniref:Acyl-CoA:6-aminopenicillanic acid acyl transferase n=1 Tax=Roseinatronobacter monicus TaxID=393481 RepID=A0A543K3D0_9RHOB|nr:C45 family peptidase [Roseinatronobacter monicus]TQM89588.1 acyl-CoA:6-aminopenicillanic acid acyl transferase [Roseinatronobacter monicus]
MTTTLGLGHQEVAGNAAERGYTLGGAGREAVAQIVSQSSLWHRVTAPDMAPAARRMADATRALFPEIHSEIAALAEGLELPFDPVFAWNARGDLLAGLGDGCTTVQLPGDEPVIAHNEDGLPGLLGHCFISDLRPDSAPIATSFCYPGSIPGHTFAVTAAGLVIAVNNLRLLGIVPEIPRMVLARAILGAADRDAMVKLLRDAPPSGGFHLSIAQMGARDIWSVSFGGGEVHLVENMHPMLHSNHAQCAGPVMSRQSITDSSRDRLCRGGELLQRGAGPLSILNDTGGAGLPIFRAAPDDPDGENTVAQFHARLTSTGIDWQIHIPGQSAPTHTGFMPGIRRGEDA